MTRFMVLRSKTFNFTDTRHITETENVEMVLAADYDDLLRRVKSVRKTSGCAMVTSAVDGATLQMPDMIRLDAFDAALPEGKEG